MLPSPPSLLKLYHLCQWCHQHEDGILLWHLQVLLGPAHKPLHHACAGNTTQCLRRRMVIGEGHTYGLETCTTVKYEVVVSKSLPCGRY